MAKEKSITELRDEKRSLATQAQGIIDGARNEKRQFADAENTQLGEIQVRMAEINLEIETRESENRGKPQPHMPEGKFSFRRALVNQLNRQPQHDAEARMIDEATRIHAPYMASNSDSGNLILPMNTRAALTAATEATTGVVVDEDQMEMLLPLEPNLILTRAGARIMNGLRGNIYWPNVSAATVSWEGENDEAKDGARRFPKERCSLPSALRLSSRSAGSCWCRRIRVLRPWFAACWPQLSPRSWKRRRSARRHTMLRSPTDCSKKRPRSVAQ